MSEPKPLLHLRISPGSLAEMGERIAGFMVAGGRGYCLPLNLTKYVRARRDEKLRRVINHADLVIADGVSIVWMARRLGYRDVKRVTGVDLAESLFSLSQERGWRLYFLGAAPEVIEAAVASIRQRFPRLAIAGYRHGYFRREEEAEVVGKIAEAKADILLLGLGMPQKEYFIDDHGRQLAVHFTLPVGGAFDVWASLKKRTPQPLQKLGLEWLYRSWYDPSKAFHILKYGLSFSKDLLFPRRGRSLPNGQDKE